MVFTYWRTLKCGMATVHFKKKELKMINIAIAGTGYVGLSIATLLAQHHKVTAVDVIPEKVRE